MNEDNKYINIKNVAEAKGLTSTRSISIKKQDNTEKGNWGESLLNKRFFRII